MPEVRHQTLFGMVCWQAAYYASGSPTRAWCYALDHNSTMETAVSTCLREITCEWGRDAFRKVELCDLKARYANRRTEPIWTELEEFQRLGLPPQPHGFLVEVQATMLAGYATAQDFEDYLPHTTLDEVFDGLRCLIEAVPAERQQPYLGKLLARETELRSRLPSYWEQLGAV